MNKYFFDGFYDQYATGHAKGLRALPIQETIEDSRQIIPYEDVVKVLDKFEYFILGKEKLVNYAEFSKLMVRKPIRGGQHGNLA